MKLPPVAGENHDGNVVFPVRQVDPIQHTPGHMCWDTSCPCHEDQEIIGTINDYVQECLLTPDNASDIVKGHNVRHM